MLCHKLENQERDLLNNLNYLQVVPTKIEEQKEIERIIKQQNELRRQMKNQQNQSRPNQQNKRDNRNPIINNLFDSDDNMLTKSDMQFFGNIPGMSPGIKKTNTNNNQRFGNQFIRVQRAFTGAYGEFIMQRFENGVGNNNMDMMNKMMINRLMMNNNMSNNRRFIPFSNFGFGGMSRMGGMDVIIQQMLQRLGSMNI